jgi:hypothetical protein
MKRIPIVACKYIAEQYGYDQVVVVARATGDEGGEHVTTYGRDKEHCAVAARMGDFFKHELMGWPKGANEWRPIKTYPRDHDAGADTDWGPNALLFVPTGQVAPKSDYRILTGRLEADMWLAWCESGEMFSLDGSPTHWMPLPEPPI